MLSSDSARIFENVLVRDDATRCDATRRRRVGCVGCSRMFINTFDRAQSQPARGWRSRAYPVRISSQMTRSQSRTRVFTIEDDAVHVPMRTTTTIDDDVSRGTRVSETRTCQARGWADASRERNTTIFGRLRWLSDLVGAARRVASRRVTSRRVASRSIRCWSSARTDAADHKSERCILWRESSRLACDMIDAVMVYADLLRPASVRLFRFGFFRVLAPDSQTIFMKLLIFVREVESMLKN